MHQNDAMTTNPRLEAALALHRFGFGPAPGSIATIAGDPRGAVMADLERPEAGLVAAANLPDSAQASRAFFESRAKRQAEQKLAQRAKEQVTAKGNSVAKTDDSATKANADAQPPDQLPDQDSQNQQANVGVQLVQNEAKVRIQAAVTAEIGFRRASCLVLVKSFLCLSQPYYFDGRRL